MCTAAPRGPQSSAHMTGMRTHSQLRNNPVDLCMVARSMGKVLAPQQAGAACCSSPESGLLVDTLPNTRTARCCHMTRFPAICPDVHNHMISGDDV